MACDNGLAYYIIGIATLASGMCIYWVGYIDFAAGGLHLEDYTPEDQTCIELEERDAPIWEKPAKCLKTVEQESFFNWHVTMMMWPFVMCATLAVTAFRKFKDKKVAKIFHLVFHIIAMASAWSAYGMAHANTQARWGGGHFDTIHSWVGMTTMVLYTLNFIFGLFFYWFQVISPESRAATIPFHRAFGLAAYGFMLLSVFLGMLQKVNYNALYSPIFDDPKAEEDRVMYQYIVNSSSVVMLFGITFIVYYLTNPDYSRAVQQQIENAKNASESADAKIEGTKLNQVEPHEEEEQKPNKYL